MRGKDLQLPSWDCPVTDCNIFLNCAADFQSHLRRHLIDGMMECESCGRVYYQKYIYQQHVLEQHGRDVNDDDALVSRTPHLLENVSEKMGMSETAERIAKSLFPFIGTLTQLP